MRKFPRQNLSGLALALGVFLAAFGIWFWMPWFRETFLYPVPPALAAEAQVVPEVIAAAPLWRGDASPNAPTANEVANFYSRWSHIESEIATLPGHPWAGQYRSGYPATASIVLAPNNGYALMESVMAGGEEYRKPSGADMSSGEVREIAGHLIINDSHILYPAVWGKRHYLLSGVQLKAIRGHSTHSLREQDLLLRAGDEAIAQDESKDWVLPDYAGDAADHSAWRAGINALFRFRHSTAWRPIPESFLTELPGSRGPETVGYSAYWAPPPPPSPTSHWNAKDTPYFIRRRAALLKEVAGASPNSWAGNYMVSHGPDETDSILIAPHHGALLTWHWVAGDISCGEGLLFADPVDEGMKLRLDNLQKLSATNVGGIDCYKAPLPHLLPVQIGERHFMLYEGEMPGLINRLNEHEMPDADMFAEYFVRDGEQSKPLAGPQIMGAPYSSYLHSSPLEGKVIAASSRLVDGSSGGPFNSMTTCEQNVTVNAGSMQGVFEGMNLYVADAKGTREVSVTIQHVETEKADGVAEIASGFKCRDLPLAFGQPLRVGQKFSSRSKHD